MILFRFSVLNAFTNKENKALYVPLKYYIEVNIHLHLWKLLESYTLAQ